MFKKDKTDQVDSKPADFKFNLGARVRDTLTGFEGIVNNRNQWLHNCNVYGIKPTSLDKDGKPRETHHFDEPQLELVDEAKAEEVKPSRETGGPTDAPSVTNR